MKFFFNVVNNIFLAFSAQKLDEGPTVRADKGWHKVDYMLNARYVSNPRRMDSNKMVACQVKIRDIVISTAPATAKYVVECKYTCISKQILQKSYEWQYTRLHWES